VEVELNFPLSDYSGVEVTALQSCTQEEMVQQLRRVAEQSRSECGAKVVERPAVFFHRARAELSRCVFFTQRRYSTGASLSLPRFVSRAFFPLAHLQTSRPSATSRGASTAPIVPTVVDNIIILPTPLPATAMRAGLVEASRKYLKKKKGHNKKEKKKGHKKDQNVMP
jgi:hypothetical protein